jgi:hypothetical protein
LSQPGKRGRKIDPNVLDSLSNVVTTRLRKAQEGLEKAGKVDITFKACQTLSQPGSEGERDGRLGALERSELPSKLVKHCHNQADISPRKAGKALETLK